ncbi:MAG: BlaI/MecI/CopY family transcriptional regulator [Kordiimonadaceae bacterium]|jgi:BlaI family transcriptional regulator, penicillinase repressor|nr:BlaI/MecI/CopY family transcriptional regulator [Kordiimonadaceae bacterium]
MARKTSTTLTEGEQRIMQVLWSDGSLTVRQVFDVLSKDHEIAYTTIQTVLTILEKKDYVTSEKTGKAHVFSALVTKRGAQSEALKSLVTQFFDGSPKALAQHLINEKDADLMELDNLQKMVDATKNNDEV